jgi:hypothetical protein
LFPLVLRIQQQRAWREFGLPRRLLNRDGEESSNIFGLIVALNLRERLHCLPQLSEARISTRFFIR